MFHGLMGGVLWALDTVILGIGLAMAPFVSTEQALLLAPFVSTFLHDAFAMIWMFIYNGVRKQYANVLRAVKTPSGKWIMLGALLGGPIGMTCYMLAINNIGPGLTAVISAMYPALGTALGAIFLKEKIHPIQIVGLAVAIGGVIALGYAPGGGDEITNFGLGFLCAVLTCIAWGSEGVILTYGMKDPNIDNDTALHIRETTSALFYGIVIITFIKGWGFTLGVIPTTATAIVALAALAGTASYLCYYKALSSIGVAKAMALNITYSAWALVFSLIFMGTVPDLKSVICGLLIIAGSIVCAASELILGRK